MEKGTPTEGGGPKLDEKVWYAYLHLDHGVVEIVDALTWPSGRTPEVTRKPGPPCGEPTLPHCSFRIVKSKFDVMSLHRRFDWPKYDSNGDCNLSIREDPAVG